MPRPAPQRHRSSIPDLVVGLARAGISVNQTRDAIVLADGRTRRIVEVNASALRLTGYERAELIGAALSKLVGPAPRLGPRRRMAASATSPSLIFQARSRRKDGESMDIEIEQRRLEDGRILGVLRSASQRGTAAGQFSQRLTRFDLVVVTVDRQGTITYANPALSALTGWSPDELVGRSVYDLIPASRPHGNQHPLRAEFLVGDLEHPLTTDLISRSGSSRSISVSAIPMKDESGAALLGQDISQERAAHAEFERELRVRVDAAAGIARLQPGETEEVTARAICKEIRGLPGVDLAAVVVFSAQGDATVMAADAPAGFPLTAQEDLPAPRSAYLRERASKGPWVERWEQRPEDGAYGRAMTLAGLDGLSFAPIRYGDSTLGLLMAGSLNHDGADLLIDALPLIAEFGSAAGALLALDMQATRLAAQRRTVVHEIVRSRAFHPVFQSIVDLQSDQVVGYEALTRFADGEPPDIRFLTAWSVGAGAELEFATLERAIRLGRRLPPKGWLNLNLSPRLLTHATKLQAVLSQADRPLVLEITEHDVISDYQAVRQALLLLRPIRIAVDDAGAGIANFAHIVNLQADFVKVDMGLVRGVDTDLARQAMIVALCHFARATGCQLIAEGVETDGEAATLRSLGVDFGQGFWYGAPMTVGAINAAH